MYRLSLSLLFPFLALPALGANPKCYTESVTLPSSGEVREVAQLFDRWNAALATGNPRNVAELYAPHAVLLPTMSNQVRTSQTEISDYFKDFLKLKPKGEINYRKVHLFDKNNALDAGVYTFILTNNDGSKRKVQARYTFIYSKRDGKWQIIHHHSSAMPEGGCF
ncbi:MAG TPA: SgcJ/EcaC family oxidoreductase [Xylella sp.]